MTSWVLRGVTEHDVDMQCFSEANLDFQKKIIARSGLGDSTGLSDGGITSAQVCLQA